ncbi:Taurine catabolism dioxygenase [Lasiodiplodia theobromae]|uniref:Taurine catabolism dioxygenase n=1 Tax=Lasiodiplodia theobromae TaxID=45133 RepID=UPI0015C3B9EF|nr:Taurine catabolism dioxygenase [Lasiodiplodia theobromae]KAF4545852.1 Taurine catabolism dioxygenase [Lasiodiplodia theobromae]
MNFPEVLFPQCFSPEVLAGKIFSSIESTKPVKNTLRGFPLHLDADLCWTPADITPEQYLILLSVEDIVAIENAMESFKSLALPLPALEPSTFVLPAELADRLRVVSKIVHTGIGFAVLRGLDPKKYSEEENTIIYCGIASHIGIQRNANSRGMAMVHIRDATNDAKPKDIADGEELAPSKQKRGMKFHADRMYADMLSLYVRGQAAEGGEQYIASSWTIYNKLMQQAPEVLRILAGDWKWAPEDNSEPGTPNRMPALFHKDGRIILQLVRTPFLKNPGLATPAQHFALDTVQQLAEENCIELDQQLGDIQIINNLAILHTRSKFHDSPSQKRHLMRLGLRDPTEAWSLPDRYDELFGKAFVIPTDKQTIPVTDFDAWRETTTEDANHG